MVALPSSGYNFTPNVSPVEGPGEKVETYQEWEKTAVRSTCRLQKDELLFRKDVRRALIG